MITPTVLVKRVEEEGGITVWLIDCPYCNRTHIHAAGPGYRIAHCDHEAGYVLARPRES